MAKRRGMNDAYPAPQLRVMNTAPAAYVPCEPRLQKRGNPLRAAATPLASELLVKLQPPKVHLS